MTNMIPEAMVIGVHKADILPYRREVGKCIFCDDIVYLSTNRVVGELGIEDYDKMVNKKVMGMECLLDTLIKFITLLHLPKAVREDVISDLLRQQKRFND